MDQAGKAAALAGLTMASLIPLIVLLKFPTGN